MFEGGLEEKLQSCEGGVQVAARDPLFDQVQLILSQVLGTGRIRGPPEKACEVFDCADVGLAGVRLLRPLR